MTGNQKKINVNSCLEVFFGYSFDGNLRLSFMSKSSPDRIESTRILHVTQGRENIDTFWTSFDLLDAEFREAFFSFCENMIDSIVGIKDESSALKLLKRRYITWKKLFQKNTTNNISKEKKLGLFGELTVLKDIIAPKYGISTAINSWGGPNMQSKDFSMDNTWYEVKTIGANTDRVQISSLSQLSSDNDGHLVVVRVERVSPEFQGYCSGIVDLIKNILVMISDESVENTFISKINETGFDILDSDIVDKYDVKGITSYLVKNGFPRITFDTIPYSAIVGVQYEISTAAIYCFAEGK